MFIIIYVWVLDLDFLGDGLLSVGFECVEDMYYRCLYVIDKEELLRKKEYRESVFFSDMYFMFWLLY